MFKDRHHKEYAVVAFVAGALALNYPLLSIYDRLLLPFGIPLLYLYVFLAWLAIIVATALIMETPERKAPPDDREDR